MPFQEILDIEIAHPQHRCFPIFLGSWEKSNEYRTVPRYNSNTHDHNYSFPRTKSTDILQSIHIWLFPMLSSFHLRRAFPDHKSFYRVRNRNTPLHQILPHMEIRQKQSNNAIHMNHQIFLRIVVNHISMTPQNTHPCACSL